MLAALGTLVPYDSALILAYHRDRKPTLLFDAFDHPLRENNIETYLQGPYLLDPFHSHAFRRKEPCLLRMSEIAPDGFAESEYFQTYYKRSNVIDEVNFVTPAPDGVALAVCYERSAHSRTFSKNEMRLLDSISPVVAVLLGHHWRNCAIADRRQGRDADHERFKSQLESLGSEVLTAREREVVQLVLQGYSNKAISAILSLSFETVKVHRRNIYSKLGISSLSELFSLAIRALS